MEIKELKPRKALNKAFLKVKPNRTEIEAFKTNLIQLLDRTNDTESEEFHKNLVSDFLKDTYYKHNHFINTKGRNDLVIHNGNQAGSTVGVIIEAKKPTNKSEMVTTSKLNTKGFQELVLYYLRERITHKNLEVKHLVITNINEWFIFDAAFFDRLFAQNKMLVKQFSEFEAGRLADTKTDFFYKQIAEPFIAGITGSLEFTYFNLQDYQKPLRNADKTDDTKLIALFKLLSPEHLLKLPFTNDSNSLDKRFYAELLHIIGLTETKEGSKKLIGRNKEGERNSGSLLEDAIIQLDSLDKISRLEKPGQFGKTQQECLFNVGLELSITWINRILFLKLLEAQLITYHKGDKSYAFLNQDRLKSYDDLNSLFFQVLARRHDERNQDVKKAFEKVPYLNSSLFEPTEIEHATLFISNLRDDKTIPVIAGTVLKNDQGKKRTGKLPTLEYLFEFLNAYDFTSEGPEEIQEDNKALINASVLGLIFEKINGYKDGSFFTPGFITMYMCRETIRRAVVQKFNETKNWHCQNLEELYDKIEDRQEANNIVNSIKICDPAVGSGHFLVSALNEMIAVKNDLKILQDRNGKRLKEYQVEVVNDELIVTDEEGELFDYHPTNKESQRIQETLFHEKQTIIENCLFGVDINPNSVKICRLRLWIELLKNAYYKNASELETLPNIDINIKTGNSLVSRFAIDADLSQALKKSKWTIDSYRLAVDTYRNAESKEQKREMERLIAGIKSDFRTNIDNPFKTKIAKARGTVDLLATEINTKKQWGEKLPKDLLKQLENATQKLKKLETEKDETESNKIFENAFEWRFEFPEVLNDDGEFVGFDVVIGNPPYIRQEEFSDLKPFLKQHFQVYAGTADLLIYFIERGVSILKTDGFFSYIIANKFMRAGFGRPVRTWLQNFQLSQIIDFGDLPVFEEATTYPCILSVQKNAPEKDFTALNIESLAIQNFGNFVQENAMVLSQKSLKDEGWNLAHQESHDLLEKLRNAGVPLSKYVDGKIYYGIKTGFNEAFVIDEETKNRLIAENPKSSDVIKPFLAGRDIKRYQAPVSSKFLLFTRRGINIEDFPGVKNHLEKFKHNLMPGGPQGRKPGPYKWFEIQDPVAYYFEFEKPKIIIPAIVKSASYNFDTMGFYSNDKTTIIPGENKFLLGLLNSKILDFYLKTIASTKQNGYFEYKPVYVSKLPIANATENEQKTITALVDQILDLKKQDPSADTSDLENQIDQLVYQLYDLTEDEIKIIEGVS